MVADTTGDMPTQPAPRRFEAIRRFDLEQHVD